MTTALPLIDDATRSIVQVIYDLAGETGRWPSYDLTDIRLDRELRIDDSQAALKSVPAAYLPRAHHSFGYGGSDELSLTLRGVAACRGGSEDLLLLTRFIQWAVHLEQRQRAVRASNGKLLKTPKDRLRLESALSRGYDTIVGIVEQAYGKDESNLVAEFMRFARERYKAATDEQIARRTA